MSRPRGRPMDPIWHQFDKATSTRAKCIRCFALVSNKCARMRAHLAKCPAIEADKWFTFPKVRHDKPFLENEPPAKRICVNNTSDNVKKSNRVNGRNIKIQPQMSSFPFATSVSASASPKIDKAIAQFFYFWEIPLGAAESGPFIDMIAELRPGYKPPTHQALLGIVLHDIDNEVTSTVPVQVKDEHVRLQTSRARCSWKNREKLNHFLIFLI